MERYRNDTRMCSVSGILILIKGCVRGIYNVPTLVGNIRGCLSILGLDPIVPKYRGFWLTFNLPSMYSKDAPLWEISIPGS